MFRAMFSPIIRSTWLHSQHLVVFTQVAAGWCLGGVETELCGLFYNTEISIRCPNNLFFKFLNCSLSSTTLVLCPVDWVGFHQSEPERIWKEAIIAFSLVLSINLYVVKDTPYFSNTFFVNDKTLNCQTWRIRKSLIFLIISPAQRMWVYSLQIKWFVEANHKQTNM
jgi:hypothetical protein